MWNSNVTLHILAYYSKATENHKLCSRKQFPNVFSSLQWCLFETSRINTIEVRDFASLCIKIGRLFCVATCDVLSTFYFVSVYISHTFKMPLIHSLHSEVRSSPVFTLSTWQDILQERKPFTTY